MPEVAMVAGLALSAVGTGYSMYNSIATAEAQAEQAMINAQYQYDQAQSQASLLATKYAMEENEAINENKRNLASMEATYAASGVTISGSPSEYLATQAATDAHELEIERWNAYSAIDEVLTDGENALLLGKATASSYLSSGISNAISSGISGIGSMAMSSTNFFSSTASSSIASTASSSVMKTASSLTGI